MGCHQSGKDAHPALQLDADDLKLIPKKASSARGPTRVAAVDRRGRLAPGKTETRRERRARLHAHQVDQTAESPA